MEKKEFKYDAFISYRHCDLDKFVATNLHRILETYELPKEVKEKLNIKDKAFKRVFRDQEELPLTSNLEDPIIEALENSKYLIVICSPRLSASLWCKKEIETFKKLRGRKNIFCVLVEGEPSESFPKEILYDYKNITLENGKTKKEKYMVEPLAADVRGSSKKEVLKKLKEEKLRLIAPMYNLDYDDLRQRHKIWKQKQMIHTGFGIAGAAILFLIYSLFMIIKINMQQNVLAEYHAKSLVDQANTYILKDDRYNAIKYSYQALTDFYGIKMPYTPEAEYMLTESLGIYDAGLSYKAIKDIKVDGVVTYIKTSQNNKYAAIYDESNKLTVFDTETLNKINSYDVSNYNEFKFNFVNDDNIAYIDTDGNIVIADYINNDSIKIDKNDNSYVSVSVSNEGKYIVYTDSHKLYIHDFESGTLVGELKTSQSIKNNIYFSKDDKYVYYFTEDKDYDVTKDDYITIHTVKLKDAKEINKATIKVGYINGAINIDNTLYILCNNTIGTKYNTVLVSFNYIDGVVNYTKTYDNIWGNALNRSYPDGNHLTIVSYDKVNVVNASNGDIVDIFNASSEIIKLYSYVDRELYLTFMQDGSVNYLNMETKNSVEYIGRYEFNLNSYADVALSPNGYLIIPTNENRVILYEMKTNPDVSKEDITLDYVKDDSIKSSEYDKVKDEYNIKNRSLVKRIFYSEDNKILFVNYTNKDIAIYDVDSKKLINTLSNVGAVNHYFGKDGLGRTYIGDISNSYILDGNYNLVGHIKGLAKVESDKVIITSDKKYYSIKIYTLDELISEAKNYLGDFEALEDE